MKKILLISIIVCSAISSTMLSQVQIDTISICYYNGIINQKQILERIQITNYSNEDYITWVDLDPITDKSNKDIIHDFFKKRKGDFSFMQMMHEDLIEEQSINVGYSFIKNIKPKETFSYDIIKITPNSDTYNNRIVILRRDEVELY